MKKTAITVAMLSLAAASSNALADGNETATVTLSHDVPLVCSIGLLATGSNDAGLGNILGLDPDYATDLELNDIDLATSSQNITGAVKCNANKGYAIDVGLSNGALKNGNSLAKIPYELEASAPNSPGLNVTPIGTVMPGEQQIAGVFSTGLNPAEQKFRLKMSLVDSNAFDNAGSGDWNETITFTVRSL